MNFANAWMFWDIQEQLDIDNEDETLSYYKQRSEDIAAITGVSLTDVQINDGSLSGVGGPISEKMLCKWEIYAERMQRYRWLNGYAETEFGKDRVCFYSAWSHFIIPGKEPAAWLMGKIDIRLNLSSANLTTLIGLQQSTDLNSIACDYQFDDIQVYVYYIEPTPEQKQEIESVKMS